jgi:hypothetical protein
LLLLVDEDVVGTDIPNFAEWRIHIFFRGHQCKQQIPQLVLLKQFFLSPTVNNLLSEEVRVVGIIQSEGARVSTQPFGAEGVIDREQQELGGGVLFL